MTTDLVPAGITEKQPFLRLAEKCFFCQKSGFPKKNTQNLLKDLYYLDKIYFFVCTTFHGRGQNMVGTKKGTLCLGQQPLFFTGKSVSCHTTLILSTACL